MTGQRAPDEVRRRAVAAMTFATGVIIANNYYMQPLEATMAAEFAVPSSAIGAVLTVIQLSYALGLATLVPLGDLLERRRLVLVRHALPRYRSVSVILVKPEQERPISLPTCR